MTVRGPREIGGVDGVDPDSCVNCLVEDSHVRVMPSSLGVRLPSANLTSIATRSTSETME